MSLTILDIVNTKIGGALLRGEQEIVVESTANADKSVNTLSGYSRNCIHPCLTRSVAKEMTNILSMSHDVCSVDSCSVLAHASWQVGVALGDSLLERYLKEEGKYPENVGIVVWTADGTERKGYDVSEVLYLMGVKPVWEKSSDRVVGVEAIPLETLKRPRIDVTVRINGLFHDTFPNAVNLLDEAVSLVINLKEPSDKNFITKHIEDEVNERIFHGADPQEARENASYRIFGDRPGSYGSGINEVLEPGNRQEQKEKCELYVSIGAYAYSRDVHGRQMLEQFEKRLSQINLTVKNRDSRKCRILDADNWYDTHCRMINAVKVLRGDAPKSYWGDSSNPERVKNRNTSEETRFIVRSRLLNPKWIQNMKKHNYRGAADLSRTLDSIFGWEATSEVVEEWMYEALAKQYVLDKAMQQWLKDVNPYALRNMTERLLEAVERNMWQTSEDMKKTLEKIYLTVERLIEYELKSN